MKINEVSEPLKTYIATVRVITVTATTTARTTITADTQQQAWAILSRLYGVGNVISISDVMHEAPESHQIQRRATNTHPAIHTQLPKKKNGPIQLSCVSETEETKTLSPAELQVKSLADQTKRLDQQAKLKKAQTGLAKAQEKLRVASRAPK